MKQIVINEISIDELVARLSELIDAKKEKNINTTSISEKNYLTRIEVARILKISLPSLSTYTKEGWLQSYKIGNRVLYKSEEIDQAIQKLSTYKYKRGL
jgi:Helix-turn-helix domain